MPIRPDYTCPRCGYKTDRKSSMEYHLVKAKNTCPILENDIELTDDIKNYILTNRIYKFHHPNNEKVTGKKITNKSNKDKITRTILEYTNTSAVIHKLKLEVQYYKNRKSETLYQMLLENFLGGKHKKLLCGVTDLTTTNTHAEIKEWCSWKDAIGQLLCYNEDDPKDYLQVYLFGKRPGKIVAETKIFDMFERRNIVPYVFVDDINSGTVYINDRNGKLIYEYQPS